MESVWSYPLPAIVKMKKKQIIVINYKKAIKNNCQGQLMYLLYLTLSKVDNQCDWSWYLAGTERPLDVPGAGVAAVVRPPVHVIYHPVQPPPQVVLGPPLRR